ncbi:serine hydrolase [candidate division KSB1 bacterium]|nr:serine hydrolase [candidate division KSB1 bacterium]
MKKSIITIGLVTSIFLLTTTAISQFSNATPESQGISSSAILKFIEIGEAEIDALHSVMILRHGQIVAQGWWEPYNAQSQHMLYSLSKSFTSTAIGMAVAEGKLSLDDTIISFFPEDTPENPSDNLKAMRIRDLLSMNSGHQQNTSDKFGRDPNETWVQTYLSLEVEHKPGTHFVYNSGASYMLSAILQKVTGETLLDFLTPRLFEPLGIEKPVWESNAEGINFGGWGLSVKTADIAKLGQLYLQKGMWNSQRLLPESWVEAASSRQTSNGSNPESDWEQGYGYQFWMCRHNLYRGDGAFGQYCIVMPEQDAVVAITSGVPDMQAVMNLVWDYILTGMQEDVLPENPEMLKKLNNKLSSLSIKFPEGQKSSPIAKEISGKTYSFIANGQGLKSLKLDVNKDKYVITIKNGNGVHSFNCGMDAWEKGTSLLNGPTPQPVAASGAWITPDHFVVKLCLYETPYRPRLDLKFVDGELHFTQTPNVSFGDGKPETLVGKVK